MRGTRNLSRVSRLVVMLVRGVTAAEDPLHNGDELANNLFSDLAPLLTLFGEQVTKQFMSVSMGWEDHVTLAMAPLGIITIMVGAIRVGGPHWLKAIIGRARENRAMAEAELMSSTSDEVCELWNGSQIVKLMGSPPIREIIWFPHKEGAEHERYMTLPEAVDNGALRKSGGGQQSQDPEADPIHPRAGNASGLDPAAPNISLNVHHQMGRAEIRTAAAIGLCLQIGVLVYAWFAVYHPKLKLKKGGRPVADYAFPFMATGAIILSLGLLICAYVVESSSMEETYKEHQEDRDFRILWLQRRDTVNDQSFKSVAIFAKDKRTTVTTSRRTETRKRDPHLEKQGRHYTILEGWFLATVTATVGAIAALFGYILLFIGLRGLNWSVTIAQLAATILMTILRAFVRRGLTAVPEVISIPSEYELDWLATRNSMLKIHWPKSEPSGKGWWGRPRQNKETRVVHPEPSPEDGARFQSDFRSESFWPGDGNLQEVFEVRKTLGKLTGWDGPGMDEASCLANAIDVVLNALLPNPQGDFEFTWSWKILDGQSIKFKVEKPEEGERWKTSIHDFEAALSLLQFACRGMDEERNTHLGAWQSMHILGPNTPLLRRDLRWWSQGQPTRIMAVKEVGGRPAAAAEGPQHAPENESMPMKGAKSGRKISIARHRITGDGGPGCEANQAHPPPVSYEILREFKTSDIEEVPDVAASEIWEEDSDGGYWGGESDDESMDGESDDLESMGGESDDLKSKDTGEGATLVALSNARLPLLFAQDIFRSFMGAIAEELGGPIDGGARVLPPDNAGAQNEDSWKSFILQNPKLSEIAQEVQRTKLGSLEEVYLAIISPLSRSQKLPDVSAVCELAHDRAEIHDLHDRWGESAKIYLWLFHNLKISGASEYARKKAVAILLEFYRRVIIACGLSKKMDIDEEASPYLKRIKKKLAKRLRGDDVEKILESLLGVYRAQGRLEVEGILALEDWELPVPVATKSDLDRGSLESYGVMPLHFICGPGDLSELENNCGCAVGFKRLQVEHTGDVFNWFPIHYLMSRPNREDHQFDTIYSLSLQVSKSLNAKDITGWTPLHYCCWGDAQDDLLLKLLKEGAEVKVPGRDGTTPLHCAAIRGRDGKILLQAGADIGALDASRNTPLHWASYYGHINMVEQLLPRGHNDVRNNQGRTPAHLAALSGKRNVVEKLISAGASLDIQDWGGFTMLHLAAARGHTETITLLLEMGVNQKTKDNSDQTPLDYVAGRGFLGVARLLLEKADQELKNSALHHAAFGKHLDVLRLLLENGGEMESEYSSGDGLLHTAARMGDVEMAQLLLEKGADIEAESKSGERPLYHALKGDDPLGMGRLLLGKGADKDAKNRNLKETALHSAAESGNLEVVRLLLEEGADTETGNGDGLRPLHYAAARGHPKVVQLLLEKGADKEAETNYGTRPLHYAAGVGYLEVEKLEVAQLLLEQGADKEAKNNQGDRPLHYAAKMGIKPEAAQLLLEQGADKEAKNNQGDRPLHYAAKKGGNPKVARLLLEQGADKEAKNNQGERPLHCTAKDGDRRVTQLLLEQGADKEAKNNQGDRPLHYTAKEGNREVARLLLEQGADKEAKNNQGDRPLHYTTEIRWNPGEVQLLLALAADKEAKSKQGDRPLHYTGHTRRQAEVARLLLEKGADKEAENDQGERPLHHAAKKGNLEVAQLLLEQGADKEAKNNQGDRPLHCTAKGSPEVARLLDQAANEEAGSDQGDTPLHYTAEIRWNPEVARLLLEKGVDKEAKNNQGNRPLHGTAKEGNPVVARLLLEQGADKEAGNNQGDRPLHLAASNGHLEVVQLLLESGANKEATNKEGLKPNIGTTVTRS